jgi:hypothetical protein
VIEREREDGGGAVRTCQHVAMTKVWIGWCRCTVLAAPQPVGRRAERSRAVITKAAAVGAVALAVTGSVAGCAAQESAEESERACVAPSVTVEPATVAPGDEVTVRGEAMMDGCADAISMDEDGNVISKEAVTPFTGLDVVYLAADTEEVLATVDADEHGAFEITVRIPQDSPPGSAEVSVDVTWAESAEVEVAD